MCDDLHNLIIRAKEGDPEAQYNLGEKYEIKPNLDYEKAAYWYHKSAIQGHASAQNELAWLYEKGMGIQLDLNEAIEWFLRAAKQGHAEAIQKIHRFRANHSIDEHRWDEFNKALAKDKYMMQLFTLLREYNFNDAEIFFENHQEYLDLNLYKKKVEEFRFLYNHDKLLKIFQFSEVDRLFKQLNDCVDTEGYISIKSKYIREYVSEKFNLGNPLDEEQSQALADIADNLLITARAGSGKTTVLTCKGMILAERQYVQNPNAILMLAFNRKAAEEIRERINKKHKLPLINIRTFHSLAHSIVQPDQEIKEDYESEMSEHLKSLLEVDPRLKEYLYEFFKKEMQVIQNRGLLLNETDYYDYAKNCWESISLGGDRVKSFGEKCIADFLFEYGLTYKYERPFLFFNEERQREIYKPDFTIYDSKTERTFILEHWAISDRNYYTEQRIWNSSITTERQYAEQRKRKRDYWNTNYWKKQNFFLLETDVSWLDRGREAFETRLKNMFESKNVVCAKLPQNELLEKVYRNHSNRLFKLFVSFIQKCRRYGYSPKQIKEKRDQYQTNNPKEQVFLRVAPEIYEKYEKNLAETDLLDFDRLIHLAIGKIRSTKGECFVCDHKNNINIRVKDLEYILIDEFQDFSKQFYYIISAIKDINPVVKLFCVGDDWQAINGFAGSDLKYFQEFAKEYANVSKRHVLTNYRSGGKIVEAGNIVMDGLGEKSVTTESNKYRGSVEIVEMKDFVIEARDNQSETEEYTEDKRYSDACEVRIRTKEGSEWSFKDFDTAKYLKAIHVKLREHLDFIAEPDSNCLILTRTNRFGCFNNSDELKDKTCKVFLPGEIDRVGRERFEEKIQVMTAHKAKGKEADIVFVLKCNLRTFPMIHPDTRLFGIFGETEDKILEEEQRLFYVALTRAKQKVFFLTEKDDQSPFLSGIYKL